MKQIKKLIFTLFDNDDKFEDGSDYYQRDLGYFDNNDDIIKAIHKQKTELDDETILSIYTRDISLNTEDDNEYTNYTFYDESGNIVYQIKEDNGFLKETIKENIDYKVGDIVLTHPDTDSFEQKLEIGIISFVPKSEPVFEPYYTILVGWDLHNHVHLTHHFFTKINTNDLQKQTLNDRLKIGY